MPVGVNVGEKSSPTCTSVSIEDPCSSTKAKTIRENTKVKDIINFNPNREDYDVHSDSSSNDSENGVDDDVQNKTPLERYVLITEKQIADKRVLLAELHEKENDIEKRINLVKSSPSSGNICSNCHARLGHTARKCTRKIDAICFSLCSEIASVLLKVQHRLQEYVPLADHLL